MPNYNAMLSELHEEFKRLFAERESLDKRLTTLKRAEEAIYALAEEMNEPIVQPPAEEAGFTDKVRNLLKANPARVFSPVLIRDALLEFDPKADPKVLLIHTHNTLKRLHKQNEVTEVPADGKTSYRWRSQGIDIGMGVLSALKDISQQFGAAAALTEHNKKMLDDFSSFGGLSVGKLIEQQQQKKK
jgi:hypothetical protein